jgi:cation transport ATPase
VRAAARSLKKELWLALPCRFAMIHVMLSTPTKAPNRAEEKQGSSLPNHERTRRHVHHKPGRRGKTLVLLMAFLVLAYLAINVFLSFSGYPHPYTAGWEKLTIWIVYGLTVPVILICLVGLYRGNASIRHLFSAVAVLAAFGLAVSLTFGLLSEDPILWVALDLFGTATAIFAAWLCMYSRNASRFFALQADKPPR